MPQTTSQHDSVVEPVDPAKEADAPVVTTRAEAILRSYDRTARKRIVIAVAVSLVVNAIFFGYAGLMGHQFILMLRRMEAGNPDVKIRRVYLPHPGQLEQSPNQKTDQTSDAATPTAASPSPSATPSPTLTEGTGAAAQPSGQSHP